ncbi:MAG: type II toxin-antitoxin system VapC family toxin [Parvibaculaceae bacterium]
MFLDASAIVAILAREPDADHLLSRIEAATTGRFYSSISAFEAVVGLARRITNAVKGDQEPVPPEIVDRVQEVVYGFLAEIEAKELAIEGDAHRAAIEACRTYGRLVAHPARLNFGDCFAYASARKAGLPLLYKGNDFAQTDIEAA